MLYNYLGSRIRRLILFSVLFSSILIAAFVSVPPDSEVVEWIKGNCHPIEVEITGNDADLSFLDNLQYGQKIISIGEQAHGIADFAKIRFRLFKYLATNHGFNIYAVEDDFINIRKLNEYIQTGIGDPMGIMQSLFRSQSNETTLKMIQWMREYNTEVTDKNKRVKVFGYDCQRSDGALNELKEIFIDDKKISLLMDTIKIGSLKRFYPEVLIERDYQLLRKSIPASKIFLSSDSVYINQLLIILRNSQLISNGSGNRDEFMAKNIRWILNNEGPNSKVLVSGHDGHVGYKQYERPRLNAKVGSMGWYLKENFPQEIFTIWMDFNRGSFLAAELKSGSYSVNEFTLPDAPENSLSKTFSKVGFDALFLDNTDISKNLKMKEWFSEWRTMRYATASFSDYIINENDAMKKEKLLEICDGVIFINEVEAYKSLKEY